MLSKTILNNFLCKKFCRSSKIVFKGGEKYELCRQHYGTRCFKNLGHSKNFWLDKKSGILSYQKAKIQNCCLWQQNVC